MTKLLPRPLGALLLLALVVLIGWQQGLGRYTALDTATMDGLAQLRDGGSGAVLSAVAIGITFLGDSVTRVVIAAAVVLLLWFRQRRGEALWLAGGVAGIALLNWSLKQTFARARPELVEHLVDVHSYSFPSGHSANGLFLCYALAMLSGRAWAWPIAATLTFLIGFSRIYLGVHWPSDVAAGWLVGAAWLFFWAGVRPRDGRIA